MSFLSEFKNFAVKGNAIDMAVGVIIGGAFGKIITSIVNDLIMPPIGLLLGGLDFKEWKIILQNASLDSAGKEIPAVTLNIGNFIGQTVDFIIIAITIFAMIKMINSLKRKKEEQPEAPPEPSSTDKLLIEIRDLLKK